jgi:hypothetical protein
MEKIRQVWRSDHELATMLNDPGVWLIQGQGTQIFGVSRTLRGALDRAHTFARSGAIVASVTRVPPDRVFIFHDQIIRLARMIRQDEVVDAIAPS